MITQLSRNSFIFATVLPIFLFSQKASALYPQSYIPAPADKHFYLLYYNYIETDGQYSNGSKLTNDTKATTHLVLFRYAYYFDWHDKRFVVNFGIPTGKATLEGTAIGNKQESSGLADPFVNAGFFFVNQPENKLWWAVSEYIYFPMGDYDKTRKINLGENRLKAITELGVVKGWDNYFLNASANITLYGDNTESGTSNATLKQEPLLGFEAHITRILTANHQLSFGGLWQWRGETQLNGVDKNDDKKKSSLQLSYDYKIAKNQKLAMFYKKDIEVENGFKVNHFSLRYHYVF